MVLGATLACCSPVTEPEALRVMSFNVRYDNPADGEHRWANRSAAAFEVIQEFAPDLLGLQEVLPAQLEDLTAALPEYAVARFGRDGPDAGEAVALFVRREAFTVEASGGFWLSPTPDAPSPGWDASLPRVAAWARLSGPRGELVALVTHLDHLGPISRRRGAEQLRTWLADEGASSAVLMGDFNAAPDGPAYSRLVEDGLPPRLFDTYRAVHSAEPGGTFHNWGEMFVDARIDWIFATADWRVFEAGVDRTQPEGIWPSDHYPVTAVLRRR